MKLSKDEKKRIMRFITYYKLLRTRRRGELVKLINAGCEFKGGTFYYKLEHKNYSIDQIETIESIVEKFKEDGKTKML